MARRKQLRQWARLRVLCCSGLSLLSVVPDAFAAVREIVPNAAAALFLTSPEGVPHAFFHEDSPESVQSLFLGEPQLFVGPHEFNVFRLVGAPGGAKVGQLMAPGEAYFRSNTYQLLVRGSGHTTRWTRGWRSTAGARAWCRCSASRAAASTSTTGPTSRAWRCISSMR